MKKKQREDLNKISILRYNPDLHTGLEAPQVEERIKHKLTNKTQNTSSKSYWEIIKTNVFTFFNFLFLVIGILFIIAEVEVVKFFFIFFVVLNTGTAIVQEVKAKITIDRMSLINAPRTKVLRNCIELVIRSEDIVLDDIILLEIGDQIPADCTIIDGVIEVNEAILTGESNPIKKQVGDQILGGSAVVSGKCKAHVEKVGNSCYMNQLKNKTKDIKNKKSKLMLALNSIIKTIAFCIVPIALFNTVKIIFFNTAEDVHLWQSFIEAVRSSGSLVLGMIPSGMILLSSIALAVGILRLSKENTMVQGLYSLETLSRVDTLCLDKTGTITDGTMSVVDVIRLNIEEKELHDVMGSYLNSVPGSNQTNIALIERFKLNGEFKSIENLPFSSSRKMSAVEFEDKGIYVLGAPEFIIDRKKYRKIMMTVNDKASEGYRVIVLGKGEKDSAINRDSEVVEGKIKPLALFIIKDNIRPEAKDTLQWFKDNGVKIKIISGDNPLTVSRIAAQVGVDGADECISLEDLTPEETRDAANRFTVFGRVSPEQKAILVKSMQDQKHNVAMTGDGINDIVALKTANCSIAMASGSDATKSVSQVILMDSNFAHLPKVVNEGRRVINNMQITSTLFLMKTIFVVIMAIFSLILLPSYEFRSENLHLVEWFILAYAASILALQPSKEPISGDFTKTVMSRALTAGATMAVPVMIVYLCNGIGWISDTTTLPLSVLLLTISAYVVLFIMCRPFTKLKKLVFITSLLFGCVVLLACPNAVLMPDFFANTTFIEMIKYYVSSIEALFAGRLLETSILGSFGVVEYASMIGLTIIGIPLYYLLNYLIAKTKKQIANIQKEEE